MQADPNLARSSDSGEDSAGQFQSGLSSSVKSVHSHELNKTGFRPEPRSAGSPLRGRLLLEGKFVIPGVMHEFPDGDLWQLAKLAGPVQRSLFGFGWLDDLAAVRSREAISLARKWVFDWISGPSASQEQAWHPDIAGRRVIRMRHAESVLLSMAGEERESRFFESVRVHAQHLRSRVGDLIDGLPRMEALAGLVYAELADPGNSSAAAKALRRLAEEGDQLVVEAIGTRSRIPQELLEITELMQWCAALASTAGIPEQIRIDDVSRRSAPILRSLRHTDGSLARFHGGGSPPPGRLDRVLAGAGAAHDPIPGLAMGYARMSAGRTTLIADAAAPHSGKHSHSAHASTLAFEMTADGTPIVVSCGPGIHFGGAAHQSARQTASHSTVEVDGASSSRMSAPVFQKADLDEIVVVFPDNVRAEQLPGEDGNTLIISHNGYAPLFGLTHMRRLDMNSDGSHIWAEDTLWAKPGEDRRVFENAAAGRESGSLPFAARFHLHPDAQTADGQGRRRVRLGLSGGDEWMFEFEGAAELRIEPSIYFDEHLGQERESRQIVLHSAFTQGSSAQLRWAFKRRNSQA